MVLVECNECKNDFNMSVKVNKIDEDIEEVYFICPHCNKRYTSYYTDRYIRDMQGKVRSLQEGLRTSSNGRKLRREIRRNKDKMQKRMDRLKEHLEK